MESLETCYEQAIWIALELFNRNKVTGSSANLSFKHKDKIYVTGSGTCFGNLKKEDFAILTLDGKNLNDTKPSKELPLHMGLYRKNDATHMVIHTHSFYSVLWSCLNHVNINDCIPKYTPYLQMKVGKIGLVPYAPPGSKELFSLFEEYIDKSDGYILRNHGPIIAGETLLDAFYGLEELEESARIAWNLLNVGHSQKNEI